MLLHQIVKANREAFDRYIFYRGLGYSVKASELLGCVTYGSEALAFWHAEYNGENSLSILCITVSSVESCSFRSFALMTFSPLNNR